jgi:hypothetical protein
MSGHWTEFADGGNKSVSLKGLEAAMDHLSHRTEDDEAQEERKSYQKDTILVEICNEQEEMLVVQAAEAQKAPLTVYKKKVEDIVDLARQVVEKTGLSQEQLDMMKDSLERQAKDLYKEE